MSNRRTFLTLTHEAKSHRHISKYTKIKLAECDHYITLKGLNPVCAPLNVSVESQLDFRTCGVCQTHENTTC